MIGLVARWIARHPVWVLVGLGCVTVFFGAFVPRIEFLSDMLQMLPQDDPVVERFEETKTMFGSQSVVMVVMAAPEGDTVWSLPSLNKLYAITAEFEALKEESLLEDVISPATVDVVEGTELALVVGPILPGPPETDQDVATFRERILAERQLVGSMVLPDGAAVALILKVDPEATGDQVKIREIMDRVNGILDRHRGPEEFYVTGDAPLIYYADLYMRRDLGLLFPVVVLVIAAVLLASFRGLRSMALPLAVVLLAVVWMVGLMSICGAKFTIASTFLPVLLVAVGSAYGIHVVNNYFERAAQGRASRHDQIVQVVQEMAKPVFIAAFTTVAAFLTLLSSFLQPIREFGLFSAAGVTFSFVISLTLIPALLSLTRPPKAVLRRSAHGFPLERGSALLSRVTTRWRWVVVAFAVVVLGGALTVTPRLKVETDIAKYFRQDSPPIQGMDFVEEKFGGSLQMSVVVDTARRDGLKDPEVVRFMDELQVYMESLAPVGDTSSLVDLIKETYYTLHGDDDAYCRVPETARALAQTLLLYEMGGGEVLRSMATRDFSKAQITARIRSMGSVEMGELLEDVNAFIAGRAPAGVTAYTAGMPDIYTQLSSRIIQSQITSLFTSLGAVGTIVAVLMSSAVAGLIALTPLALSVAGNFGTMALTGASLDIATVMIASIIVGIGVDYAVHFLTRYRRERLSGRPHEEALFVTYNTAGRAILYNASTLTLGFLVLILSSFGALQTLGWLVALTMVSSALGALLIVPTFLSLTSPKFVTQRAVVRKAGKGVRLARDRANLDPTEERGGS